MTKNQHNVLLSNGMPESNSLFELFFKPLVVFAGNYIPEQGTSEDIVQDTFVSLIESRNRFDSTTHLKAYLYQAVKNRCLKYLRHMEVRQRHGLNYRREMETEAYFQAFAIEEDVFSRLIFEIDNLPTYCRNVLLLSLEGKKNQEIADSLSITVETVKTYKKEGKQLLRLRMNGLNSFNAILILLGL